MRNAMITLGVAAVLGVAGLVATPTSSKADDTAAYVATNGYYSPKLKAQFVVQPTYLPAYGGTYTVARLVSYPDYGSPLSQLGLTIGDVITRLDGIPVTSNYELDNHYSWTVVRYIKQGSGSAHDGQINIETCNNGGGGGGGLVP